MTSGWKLLDHQHGKRNSCELQQSDKKVAGVVKQTISLVLSCCVSPKAVTYDSLSDRASQEEQRERSEWAGVDEKSDWSPPPQQDRTIMLPVLFSLHFHVDVWSNFKNDYSFKTTATFRKTAISKAVLRDQYKKKKEQTNCTHICYFCMFLTACLRWVGGWMAEAGWQAVCFWPACCTTVNCDRHRRWWRRWCNPFRCGPTGIHRLGVSLTRPANRTFVILCRSVW